MRTFIQGLTAQLGINGLGRALGVNGTSVLGWLRGKSLPSADLIDPLAALAQADAEELRALLLYEQELRATRKRARSSPGPVAPVAIPAFPRSRVFRAVVMAFTTGWACLLGQPLAEGFSRPIIHAQEGFCRLRPREA